MAMLNNQMVGKPSYLEWAMASIVNYWIIREQIHLMTSIPQKAEIPRLAYPVVIRVFQ